MEKSLWEKIKNVAKKIKPTSIFKFAYYYYKKESDSDREINEATLVKTEGARRRLYFDEKYCLVPEFYKNFVLNKERSIIVYGGKEYSLKRVTVLGNEGDKEGDNFKNKNGDLLYEVMGLKTKKEDNARFVLWIKDGKITSQNKEEKGKLVETTFSGDIEKPFSLYSVDPRTRTTNWFATILITFPIGSVAKLIKYVAFKVPDILFKAVGYALKGVVYGGFFVCSAPFLWIKKVREVNKSLLYHLVGKKEINIEEMKSQELAKKDGSLETNFDLKTPYLPVLISNSISNFLNLIRLPISYGLNIISSLIEASLNMFNSLIYSDRGYADLAKSQVKQSLINFKEKTVGAYNSLVGEVKEFSEISRINNSNTSDTQKEQGVGATYENVRKEDLFKSVSKNDGFKTASEALKKADVKERKSTLSHYTSFKSPDLSFVPSVKQPGYASPLPA